MSNVTRILSRISEGDSRASSELLPLVYDELRQLASAKLAREKPGLSLNATGLVHEAYLRLVSPSQLADHDVQDWDGEGHFFAAAAEAMRRILVENARRKSRLKHGGGRKKVEGLEAPSPQPDQRILDLDEALTELASEDPEAARVVELRHFAGLGHEQVASTLGITVYRARQKWTYARAWLRDALAND